MSDRILRFRDGFAISQELQTPRTHLYTKEFRDGFSVSDPYAFDYEVITLTFRDGFGVSDPRSKSPTYETDYDFDDGFNISDSVSLITEIQAAFLEDKFKVSDTVSYTINHKYLIYDTKRDSWAEYLIKKNDKDGGGKIKQGVSITEGSTIDNVTLLLQDYKDNQITPASKQDIKQYPSNETDDDLFAVIKTKDIYLEKGIIKRVLLSYEKNPDSDNPDIVTIVKNKDVTSGIKSHIIKAIESDTWRGIANSKSRGREFSIIVYDADVIKFLEIDYKVRVLE